MTPKQAQLDAAEAWLLERWRSSVRWSSQVIAFARGRDSEKQWAHGSLLERECSRAPLATAIRAIRFQRKALDAEAVHSAIVDDLRALVAEADRPRGGMRAQWFHELANALQLPSVVRWARRYVKALP